jgi:hypothetical protein
MTSDPRGKGKMKISQNLSLAKRPQGRVGRDASKTASKNLQHPREKRPIHDGGHNIELNTQTDYVVMGINNMITGELPPYGRSISKTLVEPSKQTELQLTQTLQEVVVP